MSLFSDTFRELGSSPCTDSLGRWIPTAGNSWPWGQPAREQALWLADFAEHLAQAEAVTWDDYEIIAANLCPETVCSNGLSPTADPAEAAFLRDALAQAALEASAFADEPGRTRTKRTHQRHPKRLSLEEALFWASLCVGTANKVFEADADSWALHRQSQPGQF